MFIKQPLYWIVLVETGSKIHQYFLFVVKFRRNTRTITMKHFEVMFGKQVIYLHRIGADDLRFELFR